MPKSLDGQIGIISGGLGDIGRAIALELARRGADVALGDIVDEREARPILRKLRSLRRNCRYDRVDVSNAEAVWQWVRDVEADLGLPGLVIPNAAIVNLATIYDLTPEIWRKELSVNLDGVFHLAQAATQRLLKKKKPGRVVFIGSWAGHAVHTHIPTYCVSKAGLRMLMQCMAAQLAPHGIHVNEVAPGYVDAGLSGRFFKEDPASRVESQAQVPNQQLIDADEVAQSVAWLCEPANRHYVGATLVMDGGLSLFGCNGLPKDQIPKEKRK
jgi:NAD(P)-dependent dehydrogenase (short-subunit alcohol dehydrogenase family)